MDDLNRLRWSGGPGHYEVYYLTLTDPVSGTGIWIRYTILVPLGAEPSASLWFLAMEPRGATFARKATVALGEFRVRTDPFELTIADAVLCDGVLRGAFDDVAWDLSFSPSSSGVEHVHPLLRHKRIAKTRLTLPHPDVAVDGVVSFASRRLELRRARGGQAHLWGSKHAHRWAWVHCSDFITPSGEPVADTFVDGVSVVLERRGRAIGPSTPVVGRIRGRRFRSISPLRVLLNASEFSSGGWRFAAKDADLRLIGEVQADPATVVGVTYDDPDGERAYCYNSEIASMRLHVYERSVGWTTLLAPGRAHFEYAQRAPVDGLELQVA